MAECVTAVFAALTFLWDKTRICYLGNRGLAEKTSKLRARKNEIKRKVDGAKKKDEVIAVTAEEAIKEAEALLDKVSDLKKETGCFRRFKLLMQIKKINEEIDPILAEPLPERVADPRPQPPVEQYRNRAINNIFEEATAEQALREVMKGLGQDSTVGVFGTGGVGKTTLVSELKRRAEAKGLFNHVVFATVSKPPNPEKIQSQIADSFGLKLLGGDSGLMRAAQIEDKIKREKRVLIILDDLWEALPLSDIGVPFGEELANCESKIIITTRDEHVCHLMKCQKKIRVETWPKLESRDFFKRTAGTKFESSEFNEIADSVADECGGLPLALVAVANALGDKDIEEWKKALRRLQQSKPPNPDYDGRVYKSIKLSYDYLSKVEQLCFLIGCLFPEDHNIENEEMARYVFGLNLFREANTVEDARGDTETIVKKLKDSGLLLEGDKMGQIKMHDVIRDVAIQITSDTTSIDNAESSNGENKSEERQVFMVQTGNHPLKEWPLRETYESYTAISVMSHDISTLPNDLICQKLHTLLLQNNNNLEEIPETFFENMTALRVLDLSGIQSSSVPSSIKTLTKLRTLHLDRSAFTDISGLGALQQLAILSFQVSDIKEFPRDMGKLINLRMLDLTNSPFIKIPPKVLSGFPKLEELYLRGSFAQWQIKADEKTAKYASFEEVINLPRLAVLSVNIIDTKCLPINVKKIPTWSKFDICMSQDEVIVLKNIGVTGKRSAYSRNLTLDTSLKDIPEWLIKATEKTEKLKYSTVRVKLNLLEVHDLKCFASLKSLVVEDCKKSLEDAVSFCRPLFESLEELRFHEMNIKDIIGVHELPIDSLRNLKLLEVQQCDSLTHALIPPNLVKRLRNIERLRANAISVEELFGLEDLDEGLYLERLKEIRLFDLYDLKHLWKGEARLADFSNLTSVSVIKCNKLSHLFSVSITEGLPNLTELWIEECAAMEEIIRDEEGITLQKIILPELKALCLMKLPKLSRFYAGKAGLVCPSLENLYVQDCSDLKARTSSFHSSNQVRENDERHMKMLSKRMKNSAS